jgi:hypothetical protein
MQTIDGNGLVREDGVRAAIAEFTMNVVAPALDRSARQKGTSVIQAGGDLDRATHALDSDRRVAVQARAAVGDLPGAELAVEVAAPALNDATGDDGACVLATLRDSLCTAEAAHSDRRRAVRRCSVPELPEFVQTPAPDRSA